MKKYICDTCGYVYDPEVGDPDSGIAPGITFYMNKEKAESHDEVPLFYYKTISFPS